jgi:hypothetical protein
LFERGSVFRPSGHNVSTSTGNPLLVESRVTKSPGFRGRRSVLLLALACCLGLLVKSASGQLTIMSASATPTLIDSGDLNPVELGVKFRADSNGYVTGLRFYKASTNVGTHVGHIWSKAGLLLGSATFTSETGSGWQQVNFSTPISVSANTTYIASYFAPSGHYSANANAFAITGIDNPPLHALANGVDGSNGVYLYSSTGGFPTNSYNSTNYWVDVVYAAAQSNSSGATGYTIMKASATPSLVDSNDPNPVEVGVKFRADSNGYVTALRFYKASTNVGTHVGHIWSTSGVLLGSATFTSETGSGWQQVNFSTPITVSANTTYIASYFAPSGHYSQNENYFATTGIDNPPLHALANGIDGPDGVYLYSSTPSFPANTYNSTNYWVDIVYTPAQSGVANSQLAVSPTGLNFGSVSLNTASTQSLTLKSTGTSSVTVNSASITGSSFTLVASTLPATLNPGQSLTLQVEFKPTVAGSATGQLTISSNSTSGSTAGVALSGTGTLANAQLSVNPGSLNFGSVALSTATTQSLTLTSTGTSSVTVNSASIAGSGFTTVGGGFPVTLNQGQSLTLQVQFKPTVAGSVTGQLTINSNSSSGSTTGVAVSGTGTSVAHQVDLTWYAPSSSPDSVAGYNIYRSTGSGSYQLMNSSPDVQTAYVDSSAVSGATYDYTVKSVDSSGIESGPSNQITVTIP